MKILLVVDYAVAAGGAEIATRVLRDELIARGHDVRVFGTKAQSGYNGGYQESFADFSCFGTTGRWRTLLQTCNPWAYFGLKRVLKEFQPDVVSVGIFLTQLSPLILPLLRPFPTVYRAHWRRAVCPVGTRQLPDGDACHFPWGRACASHGCLPLYDWLPLMIQMRLWRRWRGVFDRVLANSDMVRRSLEAHGLSRVVTVYNPGGMASCRSPLRDPPTVACAARLVFKKGVDVFLRAAEHVSREFPRTRFLVAGDGPEMTTLRNRLGASPIQNQVTFLGHLSPSELQKRFASAWVQAIPSRYEEPFALVAAEAMMRRTAVVASRVGGLAEVVVHGETGLLVPSGDGHALAQALLTLLRDRGLAEQMGVRGCERAVRYFSNRAHVTRYLEVLDEVVQDRRSRRSRFP